MILKCDFFHSLWIVFLETSRRFDLSSRCLGYVLFSFAELNNDLPFLDLCIHVKEDGGTKITAIYKLL